MAQQEYYVDQYNDGVYYVTDDDTTVRSQTHTHAPKRIAVAEAGGTRLVKTKIAPHKIEIVKEPKSMRSREWSDDGKLITSVAAIFIAITMNTMFSMPFRSSLFNSDCGHYQESLRWLNASTIAGMLCVCFGLILNAVGVQQVGLKAGWHVLAIAIIAWLLFALQAGFAMGAGDNYRIALLECRAK